MKRFWVHIPAQACPEEYSLPWRDTGGFTVGQAGETASSEQPPRPDVIFWPFDERENEGFWRDAKMLCPSLIVVLYKGLPDPKPPADLLEIYQWQILKGDGVNFGVASRLEGELCPPDWGAYQSGDTLTVYDQIKALAGSAYRLLLEELFRETREWCGHTFSVLGPA